MGKIDDMRRLREEQYDAAEKRRNAKPPAAAAPAKPAAAPTAKSAPAAPAPAATSAAAPNDKQRATSSKRSAPADSEGKCATCGKLRPLNNGLVSEHQKGFGKACPGSRKKPA